MDAGCSNSIVSEGKPALQVASTMKMRALAVDREHADRGIVLI